jgi:mono/diheme cytochrome c family protein
MLRLRDLLLITGIVACLALSLVLRRDYREPNVELVPERQMARSPAFGTFAPNPNFPDGATLRAPVPKTIPQDWEALFPYGPEPTEMVRAGVELQNPLSLQSGPFRQQGAALYAAHCQFCHGPSGGGDGPVSKRGFPPPLSFLKPQALDLKDGALFHIITAGKGNMPAFALQLSKTERWALVLHVRVLQNRYTEVPNVSLAKTIDVYKARCAACHDQDGTGSIARSKLPTLPDFSSLAWHLSKTNLEITNRIEYGDAPLMPAFRYQLPRDQILALTIYLRTFARKEGSPAPAPPPSTEGLTPVQIFRAYCVACHNVDGRGAIVRPGMPDIPDFTSAAWHASKKDAELSKAILTGGKFMPSMKDKLTPEVADRMAAYVRGFIDGKQVVPTESPDLPAVPDPHRKRRPDEGQVPPPPKEKLPSEPSPETAKRLWAAGNLFRQYCIACHGPDGSGVAAMRATLPTLPDFSRASFHQQHSDPQLLISILDGKGPFMPANRQRIKETEARDLVALIRTFGPAGSVPGPSLSGPSEFQQQFDDLQRQWEALQKELQLLKKK